VLVAGVFWLLLGTLLVEVEGREVIVLVELG